MLGQDVFEAERVIAWALALRNSSAVLEGRTFSHAFPAGAVSFQRGRHARGGLCP